MFANNLETSPASFLRCAFAKVISCLTVMFCSFVFGTLDLFCNRLSECFHIRENIARDPAFMGLSGVRDDNVTDPIT